MEINKYTFILPILFCIIIYLVGSFIVWDFNPKNWDALGRGITGFLSIFFIILGVMVSQDIEE